MEEEKIIGEQPNMDNVTSTTSVEVMEDGSKDVPSGSLLGKFKDVDSLKRAYEMLQIEFTKKCQAYSELKKSQLKKDDNAYAPFFEREDWQKSIDDFYVNHPNAKQFSNEIADVLSGDKCCDIVNNPLEYAYNVVLEKENNKLADILKDDEKLVNLISPKVKEKMITKYIDQLKTVPQLIRSDGGNGVANIVKKPLTMAEAGEVAKKLFK